MSFSFISILSECMAFLPDSISNAILALLLVLVILLFLKIFALVMDALPFV